MRKSLLTILLAVMTVFAFSNIANAATDTYTDPTLKVNTSQEESVISKKLKEIEAKQEDVKKQGEKAKADWLAGKNALKADIEKAKADSKAQQDAYKSSWDKAKNDAKAQSEANKAAAKARQQQRAEAMDNFKNSFKF